MTRRTERINDQLREEISDLVLREMKDPRIGGLVTITEVDVSPDLSHAKVFVSVHGQRRREEVHVQGAGAPPRGFLQRELRRRLTIRRMPELAFVADDSIERGARILEPAATQTQRRRPDCPDARSHDQRHPQHQQAARASPRSPSSSSCGG